MGGRHVPGRVHQQSFVLKTFLTILKPSLIFCNIVFGHFRILLDPFKALPDWRRLPL
jgi:hypothetical protein